MIRRFSLAALAAVVAVFAVLAALAPDGAEVEPVRHVHARPDMTSAVATTERVVALSFDDGPDPRWTPPVLDALRDGGARATFFVTGEHASEHPDLTRRIVNEGGELANHTYDHPLVTALDRDQVADQLFRTADALRAVGVPQTGYFRPPKGLFDQEALAGVDRAGLQTIGWTVCLEKQILRHGVAAGLDRTMQRVFPGGIILAHDGGIPNRSLTVNALPMLLERLRAEGYRVVTVSELLRLGPPLSGQPGYVPSHAS